MITVTRDLISAVRELMERHCSVVDIAAKMNLDASDVQTIVNIINNVLT